MSFDGIEIPTKKPLEYRIIQNKNIAEIEYVSSWHNSTEKRYELIEFLKNRKINGKEKSIKAFFCSERWIRG